jgi:hypothetical protein
LNYFATFVLFAAAGNSCLAVDVETLNVGEHFQVERIPFGSGTPATATTVGTETAEIVVDGLYHVPNYLPGFPTAATIWPRELPIECEADHLTGGPSCAGYRVLPAGGRGEYLFIRPVIKTVPPPLTPAVAPAVSPPAPPSPVALKKPLG